EFDDGGAVQSLGVTESENNSPLMKDEASTLARSYFQHFRPNAAIVASDGRFDGENGAEWIFTFFCGPPLESPAFTSDGEVFVDNTRTIMNQSWVGRDRPRLGSKLSDKDLGSRMRLTIEGEFQGNIYHFNSGEITILFGEIDRIDDNAIHGKFSRLAFSPKTNF